MPMRHERHDALREGADQATIQVRVELHEQGVHERDTARRQHGGQRSAR